jgi:hypothetical protein
MCSGREREVKFSVCSYCMKHFKREPFASSFVLIHDWHVIDTVCLCVLQTVWCSPIRKIPEGVAWRADVTQNTGGGGACSCQSLLES